MNKEQDIADCTLIAEKLLGWKLINGKCIIKGTSYLSSVINLKTHIRDYFWQLWDAVEKKGGVMDIEGQHRVIIWHNNSFTNRTDITSNTIEEALYECCLKYCKEVVEND